MLEGEDVSSIGKKFGLSRGSVYYALTIFEHIRYFGKAACGYWVSDVASFA